MKRKELIYSKLTDETILLINPHTHGDTLKRIYRNAHAKDMARQLEAERNRVNELPLSTDGQLSLNFNAVTPARKVRPTTVKRQAKIEANNYQLQF